MANFHWGMDFRDIGPFDIPDDRIHMTTLGSRWTRAAGDIWGEPRLNINSRHSELACVRPHRVVVST